MLFRSHHVGRGHRVDDLLSAMRGELSLAVEKLLHSRGECSVCFCELFALLGEGRELDELDKWRGVPGVQCAPKQSGFCADW